MRRVIIKSQDQIIILRTWLILLITANLFLFCTKSPFIHSYEGLAIEACCFLMYAVLFVLITLLTQMKKKTGPFLSNKPLSVPALLSMLEGQK